MIAGKMLLYICVSYKKPAFQLNRYGEVFWTMMDPVPLSPDLVSRFKDKTMAVVGYETDQARFLGLYMYIVMSNLSSGLGDER